MAKQRGAYKGRQKTLTPERAAELVQRAGTGIPKATLAHDYGISRKTVYQYLRHAKVEQTTPLPCGHHVLAGTAAARRKVRYRRSNNRSGSN
ncbi:hypothetical protein DAD99_08635 [Pseudarthrobacter sp. AB1]|nr:hypothetical protein [Pseudarthrobacter sp. AB1]